MQWLTALFLTVFGLNSVPSFAQDSVQDWSKKVIELQEKEGQNFEQDLQLVKGFLYLQRRAEALTQLSRLMKIHGKKDSRLNELYETASDQFFFQDTAELYADVLQTIKAELWAEAKDKVELGLQKEAKHRLLTLRAIQLGLILNQQGLLVENSKTAESHFSEFPVWKIYSALISINNSDPKEAYRILYPWWNADKKPFESIEVLLLVFLRATEQSKHVIDWTRIHSILKKHPEWVGVRIWALKKKAYGPLERKKEINQLKLIFQDVKKLNIQREKGDKDTFHFYFGLISVDKVKAEFEELVK